MTAAARPLTLFFDRFQRRVSLQATLRCETALRIGAGKSLDTMTSDLPVLRDARGRPIIPGASIKGVVRSQVEALLRATGARVCDPLSDGACLYKPRPALKSRSPASEQAADWRAYVEQHVCDACRIFGGPGLASHVIFSDALPTDDMPIVERRDGVSIDRDLARAAGKRKFDFEVVAAGSTFRLHVALQDLEEHWEGAVMEGLAWLDEGFSRLGGFKSRGLGRVSLRDGRVSILSGGQLHREELAWDVFRDQRIEKFRAYCQGLLSSQGAPHA
jgi:CRISPR-associated RAMP protein (TIGR02581 family)